MIGETLRQLFQIPETTSLFRIGQDDRLHEWLRQASEAATIGRSLSELLGAAGDLGIGEALRDDLADIAEVAQRRAERHEELSEDAVEEFVARAGDIMMRATTERERIFTRVFVIRAMIEIAAAIIAVPLATKLWVVITVLVMTATPPEPADAPALSPVPLGALAVPDQRALAVPDDWQINGLPATIRNAGPEAARRALEFFTARIRNPNTRAAYERATLRFFDWCEDRSLALEEITPFAVAAYVEELGHEASAATVKQHLAAIRMLFDYLVVGQVLPMNPAAPVRGPKHVGKRRKTAALTGDQARALLDSIDTTTIAGLRDRALIGVMVYAFARVSAATAMRVEDYFPAAKGWRFRLHESAGKSREVPAHSKAESYMDAYLDAAGHAGDAQGPLFPTLGRDRRLTGLPMRRRDVLRMVKRRAAAAGLPPSTCCHTFRATGVTAYLQNGGTIEKAQQIAAHQSPQTTKLYGGATGQLTMEDIERIPI
jgi:site-specific recombinase XerD